MAFAYNHPALSGPSRAESPPNRRTARIQTPLWPRTIFLFLKMRREKWACSVSLSTAAK